MKKVIGLLLAIIMFLYVASTADASMKNDKDGLDSNQDLLFFMYANEKGCYFLQPSAKYENVILVEDHSSCKNIHHGTKFVGTFTDDELWELVYVEKCAEREKIMKLLEQLRSKNK